MMLMRYYFLFFFKKTYVWGCNLNTIKLPDRELIGACAIIRSNMVLLFLLESLSPI